MGAASDIPPTALRSAHTFAVWATRQCSEKGIHFTECFLEPFESNCKSQNLSYQARGSHIAMLCTCRIFQIATMQIP